MVRFRPIRIQKNDNMHIPEREPSSLVHEDLVLCIFEEYGCDGGEAAGIGGPHDKNRRRKLAKFQGLHTHVV